MVFKRRDRRPPLRMIADFLWPRGGWGRAFLYVKHRIRRLPDSPERIARGVGVGVFTTFTPFYGMHFVVAAILARLFNGNILAALSGTFFGNPLTYVPIGVVSLQVGHWILGADLVEDVDTSLVSKFLDAGRDLKNNLIALFTDAHADWTGLIRFFDEVFYPYLLGGLLPGVIAGTVCYMLSLPVIHAYQQRRRARIKAKFDAIKRAAAISDTELAPMQRGNDDLATADTPEPLRKAN
ncbi:DUF2062 domain-containing protein [Epibacterium sp. SM1979]|uniref:DUF2062 domain-containing protein n=1 Tax=Tritonibacter litoralis TaxID=2662264 RepID=A0A843YFQ8_9RHOB|nr:DUF2062 domain-containing protein [Tritonibacter litoralis]MQQ08668.1 DUF2062 domain-containing protein [Tritonibacter litoralis]